MQQHPRLSALSIALITASLLLVSTSSQALFGRKPNNDYKGEILPVAAPCPPVNGLRDGIYIGLGAGYDTYRMHQDVSVVDIDGVIDQSNPAINTRGFVGTLFGGYGQYFDWFYIGGELLFNYSGANSSFSLNNYHSNVDVRSSYGAGVIPGIRVNENSLFYARVGYVRTFFRASENGLIGSQGSSSWKGGVSTGVGIETAIYENFSMRAEYTYTTYNSFNSSLFNTEFTPSNNQFMLSGIYHFDYV